MVARVQVEKSKKKNCEENMIPFGANDNVTRPAVLPTAAAFCHTFNMLLGVERRKLVR